MSIKSIAYSLVIITLLFSCVDKTTTNNVTDSTSIDSSKTSELGENLISQKDTTKKKPAISSNHHLGHGYEFNGNGKRYNYNKNENLFVLENDSVLMNFLNEFSNTELEILSQTINKNIARLGKRKFSTKVNGQLHTQTDFIKAQKLFLNYLKGNTSLAKQLSLLRIRGEDSLSNVHFTGYYTPVLQVRKIKDEIFKYPIYKSPRQQVPGDTRGEIMKGKIYKGYEIGYTNDVLLHYSMQVQGSGMAEYADGSRKLLRYSAFNGYSYTSLGKYFVEKGYVSAEEISFEKMKEWFYAHPDSITPLLNKNRSYVFFDEVTDQLTGAAGIPLIEGHSIAIDDDLLPYGAIFFGEKPQINGQGLVKSYEKKVFFTHDTGGAIKGAGHADFYCGVGDIAYKHASILHHYGYLWMLTIKK